MLAETIDAGLLVQLPRERMMNGYLCKPGGKTVSLLNCYCDYTKYVTREAKDQSEFERSVLVYEKSYDVFCKGVIETEVIGDKKITYLKDILEKFVTIAKVIENVDTSKCRAFKLKQ